MFVSESLIENRLVHKELILSHQSFSNLISVLVFVVSFSKFLKTVSETINFPYYNFYLKLTVNILEGT